MSDGGFETNRYGLSPRPEKAHPTLAATPEAKKEIAEPTSGMGLISSNKRSKEQVDQLYELIKDKVKSYDPEAEKEGDQEFDTKE